MGIAKNWSAEIGAADNRGTDDRYYQDLCRSRRQLRCQQWGRRRCTLLKMALRTMGLLVMGIADKRIADNGVIRDEAANNEHRG